MKQKRITTKVTVTVFIGAAADGPTRPPGPAPVHAVFTRYRLERQLWRTFVNSIIMYTRQVMTTDTAMCLIAKDLNHLDTEDLMYGNSTTVVGV